MRTALLSLILLAGCGAAKNRASLVLSDGVADDAGPAGTRSCPWTPPVQVRLEPETVWVNDVPWSVATESGVEAFTQAMALCGRAPAIDQFRAWRLEEARARRERRTARPDSTGQVGAVLIAGAVEATAGAVGATDPRSNQVAHAIRDDNLAPAASPSTRATDPALEAARRALIDGLAAAE